MSANDLIVQTVVIAGDPTSRLAAQYTNNSIGLTLTLSSIVRTISTNSPNNVDSILGLLYVPTIKSTACGNDTYTSIPRNVTRINNFPNDGYVMIGIAPWTSSSCNTAYFNQMRADGVRAAMFYQPDDLSGNLAPPSSDSTWNIAGDSGWKTYNNFPVFAIPGLVGWTIMDKLAQYSGNITDVPYGPQLASAYGAQNLARLAGRINLGNTTGIPSLWIFLIIVLAVLLAVVIVTSTIMHILQRKQRRDLQRRLDRGEVDLEILGIKRLNVPQEMIDKMPTYKYQNIDETSKPVAGRTNFTQPTCAICLDDFEHNQTSVRQLPCNHIYHPNCIDPFLKENSSLCPMCKKSTLPQGYCPIRVTNLMVRRERLIRRIRERNELLRRAEAGELNRSQRMTLALSNANNRWQAIYWPAAPGPQPNGRQIVTHNPPMELPEISANQPLAAEPVPVEVREQGAEAVREYRREQLAHQRDQEVERSNNEVQQAERNLPRWRRGLVRVFPSVA